MAALASLQIFTTVLLLRIVFLLSGSGIPSENCRAGETLGSFERFPAFCRDAGGACSSQFMPISFHFFFLQQGLVAAVGGFEPFLLGWESGQSGNARPQASVAHMRFSSQMSFFVCF